MPLVLDDHRECAADPATPREPGGDAFLASQARVIEIGLVNNMPDGALQATEQQFIGLLKAASRHHRVRLHRYAMPGVERGPGAAAHIGRSYAAYDGMRDTRLDALIVTGCEPRAASLSDEPFWDDFTRLVDWAESHTTSTLWSCLAAHAAVLHLDGIARRRLPAKRTGVFDCVPVEHHPLLGPLPAPMRVAHSRWNDLAGVELAQQGYSVLTQAPVAGVDLFVKRWQSLFVFFQGHPEYDPDTLGREFRRDIARYLRGEQAVYPSLPVDYFDETTTIALESFADVARADRGKVGLRDLPRSLGLRDSIAEQCRASTLPFFQNWLDHLALMR